jgi:2-dehydro-3-deoxygluconokinase
MRVVTFGEAMLRFSPPVADSLEGADSFKVVVAGAEVNVAVALARLGFTASWMSRLPTNALGRRVIGAVRAHGVDTTHVQWTESGRLGLYFVDAGLPPRPPAVIYDRTGSAFAGITPDDLPANLLDGADLLHITGITLALSPGAAAAARHLIETAAQRGIDVSFDLNYRRKLWEPAEARAAILPLLPLVRFLFVSSADALAVLGIKGEPVHQVQSLGNHFPRATVVLTAGSSGAWAWDGQLHYRPIIPGVEIDRIGRGDAFCAGYLFGHVERDTDYGVACGAALAGITQAYAGDVTWSTREELLQVVEQVRVSHFR